jgi:uncharacterized protein YndB with AHSA1/START domain
MTNPELKITTPNPREVVMTRAFAAPREHVFAALTRPELLRRWYGPTGWQLVVCEVDLRVGGEWHFVSRRADGRDVGQRGVYREISAPTRLVNTEWWEDWDPGESLVTTVLTEHAGQTILTSTIVFPSQEVRDTVLQNGMRDGAAEGYARLAGLLADAEPVAHHAVA